MVPESIVCILFSNFFLGKLDALLLQEASENCLATSPVIMKWKLSTHMPIHVLMVLLWPRNTQIKFKRKLDMCLWNTDVPGGQQSQNMAKIFKSYILTLSHPKGHVMSAKCE